MISHTLSHTRQNIVLQFNSVQITYPWWNHPFHTTVTQELLYSKVLDVHIMVN
jgi:hypothetical protein